MSSVSGEATLGARGTGSVIEADRPCSACGYNLKGLRVGSVCPECGHVSAARRSSRFADNLVDSKMWYLRTLACGFLLMAAALLGSIGWFAYASIRSQQWAPLSPTVVAGGFFVGVGLWFAGVCIATVGRPRTEHTVPDGILDRGWLRQAVRAGQLLPVAATGLGLGAHAAGGAAGAVLAAVAGLAGVATLFGLLPLCVYLASLADWSGDTGVGDRLRASAWAIAVCGTIVVLSSLVLKIPGLPFNLLVVAALVLSSIITFIGGVLLLTGVLQLALTSLWAVQNSTAARAREARIAARRARDEERQRHREERADAERLARQEAAAAAAGETSPLDELDDGSAIPLSGDGERDSAEPGPERAGPAAWGSGRPAAPRGSVVVERAGDDEAPYELAPEDEEHRPGR